MSSYLQYVNMDYVGKSVFSMDFLLCVIIECVWYVVHNVHIVTYFLALFVACISVWRIPVLSNFSIELVTFRRLFQFIRSAQDIMRIN